MVQFPRTSFCFRPKTCNNSTFNPKLNQKQDINNSETISTEKNNFQGMYTFNEINNALPQISTYIENDYFLSELYKISGAIESIDLSSAIPEKIRILTTDELLKKLEEIYDEFNTDLKQRKYDFQF